MQAQKTKFFFQQETWVNANMRLVVKVMGRANTYSASSSSNPSIVVCIWSQMIPSCSSCLFKMYDWLKSAAISADIPSLEFFNFLSMSFSAASFSFLKSLLHFWWSFFNWSSRKLIQQFTLYRLIGNLLFNWSPKWKPRANSPKPPPTAPKAPPTWPPTAPPAITPWAIVSPSKTAPRKP